MTDSVAPFPYSGEQWDAVGDTIPAAKAANPDLMLTVRQQLEEAACNYLALTAHHRRRFPKGKPSPVIPWKRRRALIAKALADVEPTSPYAEHLREAHRIADTHVIGYEMLGKGRKGTLNPARDTFYERVLDVWTRELQGTLTTGSTRRANKREATSPAIRFFAAAARPVTDIGLDAIKTIVAKRKQREKRETMVKARRARAG